MRSRRIGIAILFIALLVLPAGFRRWPISSAIIVEQTSASLAHSLGLELRRPARVRLSLLPTPTLHMVDVEVRGQNGETILTAPEASVRLALLPLLTGRFEPASASLRQPTILVDLESRPFASGSAISAAMRAKAGAADPTSFGGLEIHGGLVRIVSAARGIDTIVEDVEGVFSLPSLNSALVIDAHAVWRDEPIDFEAGVGALADLLKGGGSAARLSIVSRNARIELDGEILGAPTRFAGAVSAQVLSAAALERLLGLPDVAGLSDGAIAIAAQLATNAQMVTLSAMHLSLLGETFEGALEFSQAARRLAVSGTLATDLLDLGPIMTDASSVIGPAGKWSASPFDLAGLGAFDFDLRVSAAKVKWRGRPFTDAAIELLSKDGRATGTLAEASAYGGVLKGEFVLTRGRSGFGTHASASLVNADIGALCADLGWSSYTGQGDGEFAFDSAGDSPAALAEALEGKASIQLAAGVIDGVSFEEALRRSERRPIDVFNDMRMGRTVFDHAVARISIARGGRGVIDASLTGAGVDVALSGALDLVARQVSARATATQTDEGGTPVPRGPRL